MQITGTHFNYYHLCHRKLWLFANQIRMEQNSNLVQEGVLVQESSYSNRSDKYQEIELDGIKIDFFDKKERVIHEVKKSSKLHEAHVWQVKFYIYKLLINGIEGVNGVLEYPKERKRTKIFLSEIDIAMIEEKTDHINRIINSDHCPPTIQLPRCKKCSYYEFCYVDEMEE